MSTDEKQAKLLAQAIYEIRLLLGPYLGSNNDADMAVRLAAHLSYALHNEALAHLEGQEFDVEEALTKIKAIDEIVKGDYSEYFVNQFSENTA